MFKPENIIIIGGNAAGPAAAAKAKRVNPAARVIMFEEGEYISTGTCEMPYVIAGEIEDSSRIVFFNEESFYKSRGVEVFTSHRVEEINRRDKSILVRDLKNNNTEKFSYDSLILATGSTARKLQEIPSDLDNVFYIKQIKDLKKYEEYIRNNSISSALIIGAGYIGIELADALHSKGISTTIIEREMLPMPGADREIRALILETLKDYNVSFYGDAAELKANIKKDRIISSVKAKGRLLEADAVFTAAGFIPNVRLAKAAGLAAGSSGAIKTDNRQRTNDPFIYSAGDNSEIVNFVTGRHDYIPSAVAAREAGYVAGENAAGGNAYSEPVIKNLAVKVFDNAFVQTGLTEAEAGNYGFNFASVYAIAENIIRVMPSSRKVYGKIIFERTGFRILGASFFGSREVTGYADLISAMIRMKADARMLNSIDFNYTPPLSPFTNLLTILGKKIKSF